MLNHFLVHQLGGKTEKNLQEEEKDNGGLNKKINNH